MAFVANFTEHLAKCIQRDEAREFGGLKVRMRASDGWLDVSSMCRSAGTVVARYLRTQSAQNFIQCLQAELCHAINETATTIVFEKLREGEAEYYWAHPLLALEIAGWISPKYRIDTLVWIFQLYSTGSVSIDSSMVAPDVVPTLQAEISTLREQLETQAVVNREQLDETLRQAALTQEQLDHATRESERLSTELVATVDTNRRLEMTLQRATADLEKLRTRRARPKLPTGEGVYVAQCDRIPERLKIGRFKVSPDQRHTGLRTGAPTPMRFLAVLYIKNADALERQLHATFDHRRPNTGEWFEIAFEDVLPILQAYANVLGTQDAARLLTADTPELRAFNDTLDDLNLVELDTDDNTSVSSEATTISASEPEEEPEAATCLCGRVFRNERGLYIHAGKAKESESPCYRFKINVMLPRRRHVDRERTRAYYTKLRRDAALGRIVSM